MKGNIEERACDLAVYIIENRTTVRAAAKRLGVSKSTIHKDMETRLAQLSAPLYQEVTAVFARNKAQRHLRGGEATRRRYARLREHNI